jgi:hypothetical protein
MQTLEITKEELLWNELAKIKCPFNVTAINPLKGLLFYQRADRTVRDWAEQTEREGRCEFGICRRIPDDEAVLRSLVLRGRAPLAHWEIL